MTNIIKNDFSDSKQCFAKIQEVYGIASSAGLCVAQLFHKDVLTGNIDYVNILSNSTMEVDSWIANKKEFYTSHEIPFIIYLNDTFDCSYGYLFDNNK